MSFNKSRKALIYALFDRAVDGKVYIYESELEDLIRFEIGTLITDDNPVNLGKLCYLGDSIELLRYES